MFIEIESFLRLELWKRKNTPNLAIGVVDMAENDPNTNVWCKAVTSAPYWQPNLVKLFFKINFVFKWCVLIVRRIDFAAEKDGSQDSIPAKGSEW